MFRVSDWALARFAERIVANVGWSGTLTMRTWAAWILTILSIAVGGSLLLPFARNRVHVLCAGVLNDAGSSVLQFAISFASILALLRTFPPRRSQLTHFWTHPPNWLAVFAGFVGLTFLESINFFALQHAHATCFDWFWFGFAPAAIAWVVHRLLASHNSASETRTFTKPSPALLDTPDWSSVRTWLQDDDPAEVDRFHSYSTAERLHHLLKTGVRSIALIGAHGSGKSTIIRWLVSLNERSSELGPNRLLISDHSCWGFEDSASVIQVVLRRAINQLTQYIDTSPVSSLPAAYRDMSSAAGGWIDALARFVHRSPDPIEQFGTLNSLIACLNTRLVIVIEDLDRNNGHRFDVQDVLAFLRRLKDYDRMAFVLTIGNQSSSQIDVRSLCRRIERIRLLAVDDVARCIDILRLHCLTSPEFPHAQQTSVESSEWNGANATLEVSFGDRHVFPAACRLLRTPRSLKCVLSHTLQAWTSMFGEVDWDCLFAANILRYGAPATWTFLEFNWFRIRVPPGSGHVEGVTDLIRDMLRKEWSTIHAEVDSDSEDAMTVLGYLLPSASSWLQERSWRGSDRIQGIERKRYWMRILHESIDSDEVRDQELISDIQRWLKTEASNERMIQRMCDSHLYSIEWGKWARRHLANDSRRLLLLGSQIVDTLAGERQDETTSRISVVATYSELALPTIQNLGDFKMWLMELFLKATSGKLTLVYGVWRYLARGAQPFRSQEDHTTFAREVAEILRQRIDSEGKLSRALDGNEPTILNRIVREFSKNAEQGIDWRGEWSWLPPLLLEAVRQGDGIAAVEACAFVATRMNGNLEAGPAVVDRRKLREVFGEGEKQFIDALASTVGSVPSEFKLLAQAIVDTARKEFEIERDGSSPT